MSPTDSAPFAFLRNQFGFVPSVFRAQTARPDVLEAEVFAIRCILLSEEALSRRQKERILRGCDPSQADLTEDERALVNFAARLSADSPGLSRKDIEDLTACGSTGQQILEAVAIAAFAGFFGVLQTGLGAVPDFVAPRHFPWDQMKGDAENAHLSAPGERHYEVTTPVDPDRDCVARVQSGDLDGFEDLMNRHRQRIYRTLVGILGDPDEALDAMQDTFLKAFQHLPKFEGRSKFSTWLGSIATNTGIERLRRRRPMESLDESGPDVEGFRPREVQAWTDDPEQSHSRSEMRALVENGVMALPAKYRVVLMLRDIEQLTIEETASALGLGVPAIKSRLLRARLMLRETLAPHFISSGARPRVTGGNL